MLKRILFTVAVLSILIISGVIIYFSDYKIYMYEANKYYNQEKYYEASKKLDIAIRLNPNYAEAYYDRVLAKMRSSRHDEALQDFDKAISLEPNNMSFHEARSLVQSLKILELIQEGSL